MQNSAPRRSERESNFELLRIVAMFLVVLYHASGRARGLVEDQGLSTAADFPKVLEALAKRGYTQTQIEKIAGLNLYRVLRETNRGQEGR